MLDHDWTAETAAFEAELAAFCAADRVVCGGSWTGFAGVVLDWFGVPGDEVILPAYTYCATANVVLHRGATPVLVDLPETPPQDGLNLTWAAIEPHLNERTKVVMPVDIGGGLCPVEIGKNGSTTGPLPVPSMAATPVQEALGRPLLLSDAAHSLGATVDGQPVGFLADLSSIFSFHAVKNLTTAEGGAVAIWLPDSIDADEVHHNLRTTALHGQSKDAAAKFKSGGAGAWRYDVLTPGFKCNMTDIQAAMGGSPCAATRRPAIRRALGDRYDAALADLEGAMLPKRRRTGRCTSDHLYPRLSTGLDEASSRDGLMAGLADRGIASNVHFQPLPLLSAYRNGDSKPSISRMPWTPMRWKSPSPCTCTWTCTTSTAWRMRFARQWLGFNPRRCEACGRPSRLWIAACAAGCTDAGRGGPVVLSQGRPVLFRRLKPNGAPWHSLSHPEVSNHARGSTGRSPR